MLLLRLRHPLHFRLRNGSNLRGADIVLEMLDAIRAGVTAVSPVPAEFSTLPVEIPT